MKLSIIKKIEPAMAIVVFMCGFLTKREVLPLYLYYIIATLVGIYFFPIKILIPGEKKHQGYSTPLGFIITYITISFLVFFSIIVFYLPDSVLFRNTFHIISFVNFGQFFFYLKDKKTYYVSVLHMCIALVASVTLYI